MKRIVSVALPSWAIESACASLDRVGRGTSNGRETARHGGAPGHPFALVESSQRGVRLTAVNAAAEAHGILAGDALADARAVFPALATAQANPAADRARLRRLARWLGRYGIARNAYGFVQNGASGYRLRRYSVWVDISGVAHLYGGEEGLLADMARRLASFGLTARLGLACTFGAAHALAWFGCCHRRQCAVAAPGAMAQAVAGLPVEALRLDSASTQLLGRLGFKTIGSLIGVPRLALERRFRSRDDSARVMLRLDQALGERAEPRRPLVEPPAMSVEALFADPLVSADGLSSETGRLVGRLCVQLEKAGLGVRALRLAIHRSDGTVAGAAIGTSRPAHDARHLSRLLAEKIAGLDLGFGVDMLVLEAARVEAAPGVQQALTVAVDRSPEASTADEARAAVLIDRLANRLGRGRVARLMPRASHWPERAEILVPALSCRVEPASPECWRVAGRVQRPLLLLAAPEPVSVMAEVPEGAPVRLSWRRLNHRIVRASGPERIEPEWWREIGAVDGSRSRVRDYYTIETAAGARFWVFRAGRYGADDDGGEDARAPGWFIHGVFG